ncbi:MAG TPA: TonB-dependent receptor [Chitinophagaceae bacterium]|jgi:TonB-linked SusC/RagA family outer membrane protein
MRQLLLLMGVVLLSMQLFAQQRSVSGKVTDANGKPVFNATVLVKGSSMGTTTKEDGTFTLNLPATAKTLVISSVGLAPQEVSIGNRATLLVALQPTDKDLQEVVVVGYGTQKKADITSAITKVGGDKVANVPFSSVDQTLQGKVAGMQSVTFSGQPGANQSIRIRGIGSYAASAQPLFVIDGIQINSGDLSRQTTSSNVLAQLNPDDIESISVLKDAAATSIYGARGSNGVIVITTKRGKSGKTKFNATVEAGSNIHGDLMKAGKPLRTADWLTLYKEGYTNSYLVANPAASLSTAQAAAATSAAAYGDGTVDTDWPSLLLKNGPQEQYNISASGGDAKTQFFISGGYFKQIGTTIGEDLTRYSTVINLDHQVNDKLSFSLSIEPSYTKQNSFISNSSAFASPTMEFYFERPTSNPFNADGSYNIDRTSSKNFSTTYNPLYIVAHDIHSLDNFSAIGKAAGTYNILSNLKFTTSFGMQYNNLEEFQYNNPLHGDGAASNGRGYSYYTRYALYDWVNQLSYHANLTKDNNLTLDLGAGTEAINSRGYNITSQTNNYPTLLLVDAANASTPVAGKNDGTDYNFASYFSRGSLTYKGKYILAASFRRDGSSRFSESHEYGNFPSASLAWNVSKENFMDNLKFVSDVKLRASYGSSGNAEIGNYTWRQTYGYGLNYNNLPGGGFNGIGNSELQWEHANQADIGLDASFFKNRVSLILDYYDKKSDKLLFNQPLSLTTGFGSITNNIGALTNKGIEVTVNATPVAVKNFTWDISFNFTHNKNVVTQLPPGQTQIISGVEYIAPGHDIYEFYMRQWAGVDPATGNPLWYVDNTKATTTTNINAAATVPVGKSASPKYFGGFSNTFTYRGFGLSADFYYNYGNYVRDQWASYLTDEVNSAYGKYAYTLNRWQKPGDITNVPKLYTGATNSSASATNSASINTSTRFLYKGDFIRLRNIVLSYSPDQKFIKKIGFSSLKVYVRATNLWTKVYDNAIPFDPEQGISSQSNLNVLYNKSVTAGLSLGF